MEVKGAVVLVTGASSGIGRATALAFDRAGARVALAARRQERLEELAGQMRDALVLPTDLSREHEVNAMVDRTLEHFGGLDVLVNNAGAAPLANSDGLDPQKTRELFETNLIAPMIATQRAVKGMRKRGRGHIINVCSPSGFLGVPLLADYSASKAAMSGWTRTLQAEWAGTEIAITEVLPGLIDTELGRDGERTSDTGKQKKGGTGPLKALSPERVGEQLVACVRRPRPLIYTSFGARVICWLIQAPRLRRLIGAGIGRASRRSLGLSVFSQDIET